MSSKTIILLFKRLILHAKRNTCLSIFLCALVGLATGANTLVKQYFFELVEKVSLGGNYNIAISLGIFWGVFTLFTFIVQGVSDVMIENLGIQLTGFLGREINQKAAKVDAICFEDTNTLNKINRAYEGVKCVGEAMQLVINLVAFYIPYFLFFAVYTYHINPLLCLSVLSVLIPTIAGHHITVKFYDNLEDRSAPIRRRMNYYQSCITDKEYVKETRLLGAVWFFRALYESSALLFQKEKWKTNKKCALLELAVRVCSLLTYVIILLLMYHYLKSGYINTAVFAAILTSMDQMFNNMDYVGYNLDDLSVYLPAVKNGLDFLDFKEREADGNQVVINSSQIEFENVSFQYPGREEFAIKDVTLRINEGETIAIVGENGSGKSTFVKLLMGLYIPTKGAVFIDGCNTKKIDAATLKSHISAVFQDYQKYKIMNLKENITISQTDIPLEENRLKDVVKGASLNLRSFPQGFETVLSREFNGTDLSGGQWQRIAIGRGLYRRHELIVLDEPTAAIDPIEETRLYNQFADLSKDKTAIIVTHRLGSAKIANRILVMDQGQIEDIGTHEELMSRGGKYRLMYDTQSKWYA